MLRAGLLRPDEFCARVRQTRDLFGSHILLEFIVEMRAYVIDHVSDLGVRQMRGPRLFVIRRLAEGRHAASPIKNR